MRVLPGNVKQQLPEPSNTHCVQCTQCTVYTILCTVYTVYSTLYTLCTQYTIQCKLTVAGAAECGALYYLTFLVYIFCCRCCRIWCTARTCPTPPSRWACTSSGWTGLWRSSSDRATRWADPMIFVDSLRDQIFFLSAFTVQHFSNGLWNTFKNKLCIFFSERPNFFRSITSFSYIRIEVYDYRPCSASALARSIFATPSSAKDRSLPRFGNFRSLKKWLWMALI